MWDKRISHYTLFIIVVLLHCSAHCEGCLPTKDLGEGVTEVVFEEFGVKVDFGARVLKAKVNKGLGASDWSYASLAEGPAKIRIHKKGKARSSLVAELVGTVANGNLNWAVFSIKNRQASTAKGHAFFEINGQPYCLQVTSAQWDKAVKKIFGKEFRDTASLEVEDDEAIYSVLGLQD